MDESRIDIEGRRRSRRWMKAVESIYRRKRRIEEMDETRIIDRDLYGCFGSGATTALTRQSSPSTRGGG